MEYLVFKLLFVAVTAAVIIWKITGAKKIEKPTETEDGNFAITKPEDEFMEGIEYDEIKVDPKFKVNAEAERIKNPNGTPTGNPR